MATTTQDDSFREIQLGGKQLVFLFMAVVVIGVGVFLMGVLVGRGVLATRGAPGADSTLAAAETEPPPPPASASPGQSTSPATAGEKLSYAERLGSAEPPSEPLKPEPTPAPAAAPPTPRSESPAAAAPPVAAAPAPPPPPAKAAAQASPPPAKTAAPAAKSVAEPAGAGFAIQVAALRESDEADAIVKRLAGKGYPAYVVAPAKGTAAIYRVRVGKFKDRHEADTMAARLEKEEQFKPWVVR
jgi:DedD protein